MQEKVVVKVEKLYEDVILPAYSHFDDSGMDVRAYFSDEWVLQQRGVHADSYLDHFRSTRIREGQRVIIPTGLKVAIPNGYEIQIRPRSGMTIKTGLTVINTPGTIDAGYRGEIGIIIINTNPAKNATYNILKGEKIAG